MPALTLGTGSQEATYDSSFASKMYFAITARLPHTGCFGGTIRGKGNQDVVCGFYRAGEVAWELLARRPNASEEQGRATVNHREHDI